MPIADRVLLFPATQRLRPAKATLHEQTRAGVRRLIALAPVLGQTNPAGVPVVERVMLNLIDAPPPDPRGGSTAPVSTVSAPVVCSLEPRRATPANPGPAAEYQARVHRCLMAVLRNMAVDLTAAS